MKQCTRKQYEAWANMPMSKHVLSLMEEFKDNLVEHAILGLADETSLVRIQGFAHYCTAMLAALPDMAITEEEEE